MIVGQYSTKLKFMQNIFGVNLHKFTRLKFRTELLIDLFSLYVLLPHFRPRDGTLENHCFQILKYLRAYE